MNDKRTSLPQCIFLYLCCFFQWFCMPWPGGSPYVRCESKQLVEVNQARTTELVTVWLGVLWTADLLNALDFASSLSNPSKRLFCALGAIWCDLPCKRFLNDWHRSEDAENWLRRECLAERIPLRVLRRRQISLVDMKKPSTGHRSFLYTVIEWTL